MTQPQNIATTRMTCPSCGRFLGSVSGNYLEPPPCACGWQTTVRLVAKGGRQ